jgi:anthranilate synthase component 2
MRILFVDNYDSFIYNLVQIVKSFIVKIKIVKINQINIEEVRLFDKIIFSQGPGLPVKGSPMEEILEYYSHTKDILGVCLGHQAIGKFYGGEIIRLKEPYHGRIRNITVTDKRLYHNLSSEFNAGMYHSWVISSRKMPDCLQITTISEDRKIMSVSHKKFNINGIQFHHESIMTKIGHDNLKNWINNCV